MHVCISSLVKLWSQLIFFRRLINSINLIAIFLGPEEAARFIPQSKFGHNNASTGKRIISRI